MITIGPVMALTNDQYGHNVGDEVLCQVAQRCRASLRKDDLLARWGAKNSWC